MIKRIVKLHFREEEIENFEKIFEANKAEILSFEGCKHLELWQDAKDSKTFFTYSIWNSEEDLDAYRQSKFFKNIWPATKAKFSAKPAAWTIIEK